MVVLRQSGGHDFDVGIQSIFLGKRYLNWILDDPAGQKASKKYAQPEMRSNAGSANS